MIGWLLRIQINRYFQTLQPCETSSVDWWLQWNGWQGDFLWGSPVRKLSSSSKSCPMKFRFGDIIGRAALTILYASTNETCWYFIMYAIAIVALRDTPAWQCTNTFEPLFRAFSEIKKKFLIRPTRYSYRSEGLKSDGN